MYPYLFHVKQHVECMVGGDASNEVSLCRNKSGYCQFSTEYWVVCKIETAFVKVNRGSRNSEKGDVN